ncbi:McrB family protein [Deefgea salmonis]|uniref:AAA family ATPase n=1 Tax=Deefgea salmonis TaxID=2875502 RepID=A0ABS8BNA0_9NEIS|nr:AAA family ATPase [Deefgea salmonis]MCB5197213.1 AAA family ATPase [Deefgea salmonis]
MSTELFEYVCNELVKLVGKKLDYISKRNSVEIISIDHKEERILATREHGGDFSVTFERIRRVTEALSRGKLIDINEALASGGNERSAIEAFFANLPHVGFYKGNSKYNKFPQKRIAWFENELHVSGEVFDASNQPHTPPPPSRPITSALPKPFILLAGISGTGKTRFVRQQANASVVADIKNFELIAVRPDWHEPSDLLGYVSRIDGTRYVATPFLQFMAAAWRDAAERGAAYQLKAPSEMTPFWVCLDEMNLAPVEQYFADYLSVLETREWSEDGYRSEPIFAPAKLLKSSDADVLDQLRSDLGFADEEWIGLWAYFVEHGMPLPPNLIVAGTVNMDETTHGFSRKVIDRAFTIDFGEFFPNDYQHYFEPKRQPVTLGFPLDSRIASAEELKDVAADPDGSQSIAFLQRINDVFKATPFELAFRALNELLVMLKCFSPQTDAQLYAVWDDFLMAKLLPRLEGDEDKLQVNGDDSLLIQLKTRLATEFASTAARPDLFNTQLVDGTSPDIPFRSLKKLGWMQDRLVRDRFTSFWP